jgi:ascorbate PTS system EIIC component
MLDFIVDILSEPSVLVGLVALIGLILQKKSVTDCITGTVKTIMGFIVLGGGATLVVGSLSHFGKMFEYGFGISGIIPNNEAIVSLGLTELGRETALIMALGMLVNILIARFTKMKYIFLTGHHTLYMACMLAVILVSGGIKGTATIVVGAILLGFIMASMPAIIQPFMRKVTGTDEVAFGHFGTFGYVLSALVGKAVGKNSKSTEEINFPQSLTFLRDTSVAISVTMLLLYLIVAIAAGSEFVAEISGGKNLVVFSLIQSITFAGGVYVILAGVRLILAEIVPAFRGIAMRLVPNAKPALDCPVVFPYAPNAVLIGFLSSFVGGIVGLFILLSMGAPAILPGVVPHFFCGATAGVFGNATGGRRGAVLGAFAQGLLITFLPALLMPVLGGLGFAGSTFSDADFGVFGILIGKILSLFQ